ncbi:hypothetical protein [Niallia sp. 01092]|uniref:hypothetical protein n=1 Tax=unclassified Niallia TaxID=2837522 RepID=UPI003FD22983
MSKKKKHSLTDHIFAITTVSLMCLAIILVPFLFFYLVIYTVSLTSDVYIDALSTFSTIKIIFQFFAVTVVVTGIVDTIFSKILNLKKGFWGYISETLLMFAFFYLYVIVYTLVFNDIIIKGKGYLYVSAFLLVLYLLIHVVYILSKKLHTIMVKK